MAARAVCCPAGWLRKFHSCGTRSPARTRRCALIRLRISSLGTGVVLAGKMEELTTETQRHRERTMWEQSFLFLLGVSVPLWFVGSINSGVSRVLRCHNGATMTVPI